MKYLIYFSSIVLFTTISTVYARDKVPYPAEYRNWTHVKSLALHEGHPLEIPFKGIHHIYANKSGVQGIKKGNYQDGATIVFDLLEYVTANKASAEGKRKLVGVMIKDSEKYQMTGGWGFEAWSGKKRLTNDKGASCFSCHDSQEKRDYVFSQWRE